MKCNYSMMMACGLLFAMQASVLANFGDFGFLNNDGTSLTYATFSGQRDVVLDGVPELVNEPGYPNGRGVGSFYYGDGQTHPPVSAVITPWSGTPTNVGITITNIQHNGGNVGSGFRIASGELGGFNDIFTNGVHPQNQKGLNETLLFVTAQQITDGIVAGTGAHAHIYFEADQPGTWEVAFELTDLGGVPLYDNSAPFSMRFVAVPEPASAVLVMLGATALCIRRRRQRNTDKFA